jgi:signal transduction histidine kinase/DNA-binding response OmpR family regulator
MAQNRINIADLADDTHANYLHESIPHRLEITDKFGMIETNGTNGVSGNTRDAYHSAMSAVIQEYKLVTHEHILLVDDSPQIRDFVGNTILRSEGYEVITASSAEEAYILAQELQPDLIIADYLMPGMTGLDLVGALKKLNINVPFILVTAEGSEALAVRALRAGVYDYLIKPFEADELLNSIRSVMDRYWSDQIKERVPAYLLESNRKLEKRVREMATLVGLGKSVTSMLDLQQVLNQVVESAVSLTSAEESSLFLIDPSTGEMYMRAARNFDQKTVHTLRLKIDDSFAGQVVQTGQPIILNDEGAIKIKTSYLVKNLVYVPLRIKNNVVGVLSVDNRFNNRPFEQNDVQVLNLLADFAAIAIENSSLYSEVIKERNTLDSILRDTEDHVIVVDADDNVLFCNPTARRAFNVTMMDFIGKPLNAVIDHPEVLALFSKQALVGRGRRGEIRINNGEKVLHAQLTIIDGVGRCAVMQDISHLKELDKAKSDFVATVSHDLRSPLTSILAYVELIQRAGPINPAQHDFIEQINKCVSSISLLISELLEMGKIEAGFDVDLEPVNVAAIIRDAVDSLSHQLNTKRHHLDIKIAPDAPVIQGNGLRLRQVMMNLIGNAIKYTPDEGKVRINLQPDGDCVVLQVADSGIGIPMEDQPYIFDKFYRTNRAVKEFEGTGLGLAIVKGIVEQHQGRIWLESKENEGTTFTVVLPVQAAS